MCPDDGYWVPQAGTLPWVPQARTLPWERPETKSELTSSPGAGVATLGGGRGG